MVPEVVLSDDYKQPDFTGMVDHGAIGVFDNFVKWEFCDSVIDSFEFWHAKKHIKKDDVEVKVTTCMGKELTLDPMSEGQKQFNYRLDMGSAIHEEHIEIFHKNSNNALTEFWRENGADVKIEEVMQLDEYCGRIPPVVYINQGKEEAKNGA